MAVAASSPSGRCWKYDVFINFRGEDTRKIFVGHLYRALKRKAIHTYVDSEELTKGNDLSKLLTAIQDSRLSIIVLSKNYASSKWCLIELVEILGNMDAKNQIVVPVFYEVDPSDIRKMNHPNKKVVDSSETARNFAEAFVKHKKDHANKEEVDSWETALIKATNLSGWVSRDYKDEGELIEKIVKDIFHKLIQVSSSKSHGLIGMDYHCNEMYSLLDLGVDDVRFVGIWGMGGIGKTTIAKAVYDEIACHFEHSCFLDDVRTSFMKKGKAEIQEDFLSRILGEKMQTTGLLSRGSNMIMERLGEKKVLLVLDDLDDIAQIETLLGEQPSFGGGSRIILTTRYIRSLSGVEYQLYKPECLTYDKAHELFMKYAFRMNKPSREYDHLTQRAIRYAQGLPLALKVLGASLYNRSVPAWEDVLEKIKETPQREIQDVLISSFDGLEASEKNIFLDVACFFIGKDKTYATKILKICGFFPDFGLGVLVDKALVTIGYGDRLEMHDLLVEMGRKIGRASRLWSCRDCHVLTENTATVTVEAIVLDLRNWNREEIYWNSEAFHSMKNLRLLKIYWSNSSEWCNCKQYVNGHLKFLSHQLRLLEWHSCPLKSLPSDFQPLNLVYLSMPYSCIEQLWEGTKPLRKLQFINLSHSQYLEKTVELTGASNLKKLILEGCTSLFHVHPSNLIHENLVFLNLKGCRELKILPSSIYMRSLRTLNLSGCSNLEKFPEISGIMMEISEINLDETAIKELPSSIERLWGLEVLSMRNCRNLVSLPDSICNLAYLQQLYLAGCSKFYNLPDNLRNSQALAILEVHGSGIEQLPFFMKNKETLREGVIRVSGEGLSSSELAKRRDYDNLFSPVPEPQSGEKRRRDYEGDSTRVFRWRRNVEGIMQLFELPE